MNTLNPRRQNDDPMATPVLSLPCDPIAKTVDTRTTRHYARLDYLASADFLHVLVFRYFPVFEESVAVPHSSADVAL